MGMIAAPDLTSVLRLHANRRLRELATEDTRATEERQLLAWCAAPQETRFGRDHGFASIHDVRGYQERVPLRSYGQLWDEYWREPFPILDDVTWPAACRSTPCRPAPRPGREAHPLLAAMVRSNRRAAWTSWSITSPPRPRAGSSTAASSCSAAAPTSRSWPKVSGPATSVASPRSCSPGGAARSRFRRPRSAS